MVENVVFHINTLPFFAAIEEMDRVTDRATKWALREGGRQIKRQARSTVRVYGGGKSAKTYNREGRTIRDVRVTTGTRPVSGLRAYGNTVELVPGLLRDSIKSSRQLTALGDRRWGLSVGPRGGHVHLYAPKIEGLDPYMAPAVAAMVGKFPDIFESSQRRALARYL